jgi:predicted Zn-dependent protease
MRARDEAFRILESTLATASQGVDGAEVALAGGEWALTRFDERGIVESSEHAVEQVSVRIAHQGGVSRVLTTDLSTRGIERAVEEAKLRVQRLQVGYDAAALLPDPQSYEDITSFDEATAAVDALERTTWASRPILAAKASHMHAHGVIRVERGAFEHDGTPQIYAVANTHGLLAYHSATHVTMELDMLRADGSFAHVEDGSYAAHEIDPSALVARALERADASGARSRLETGAYVAVLDAPAVGRLIRWLGLTCGARMAEGGASFLSDNLGRQIVDERVNVVDDFTHPSHRGLPFDVEGVARQKVEVISRGVAQAAVYAWSTAVRHDGKATGHRHMSPEYAELEGAEHLVMSGTDQTVDDLVRRVDFGVYVSDLTDVRVIDTQSVRVTGVTKGGGRLIEGGQLSAATPPMRFEVSVIELLNRIGELGASQWAAGSVVPPLLVRSIPLFR